MNDSDTTSTDPTGNQKSQRRLRRRIRQSLAWGVHFYTALGLVASAGIIVALINNPPLFQLAFILMGVAIFIDATDGTLARLVKVRQVLPGFDGRRLDDLIDFINYTFLPIFLIYQANLLTESQQVLLLIPLLASAYGFCQVSAKTDDGYFLGFPSYWNLIAFYLYVLQPPNWLTVTLLMSFAVLTFLPARYLYPTQRGRLNRITNELGALWGFLLIWILWSLPSSPIDGQNSDATTKLWTMISLLYPVYYLLVSWTITWRIWRRKRRDRTSQIASA